MGNQHARASAAQGMGPAAPAARPREGVERKSPFSFVLRRCCCCVRCGRHSVIVIMEDPTGKQNRVWEEAAAVFVCVGAAAAVA